jgi:TonB family protein
MSNSIRTSQRTLSALTLLLSALLLVHSPVSAQSSADTDKDGKISDAERAKRDADKVFSFIKFHTVRPAAPAAAAPRPAPRPVPAPVSAAAAAVSPAVARALAAPAPVAAPVASAPVATAMAAVTDQPAAAALPVASASVPALDSASTLSPNASLPPTAQPPAQLAQPVLEPEEEVPLRLIAYVAPEMNAQVLAAIASSQVVVPVRFVVEPDGKVSSALVRGNAPRRVGQAAVRAVQQWRFDKIPAVREVDVEIAFKAAE